MKRFTSTNATAAQRFIGVLWVLVTLALFMLAANVADAAIGS